MINKELIETLTRDGRTITAAITGDDDLGPLKLLPGTWKNMPNLKRCRLNGSRIAEFAELAGMVNRLTDIIRDATQKLEYARYETDALNQAKSMFLANMSHEFRTPLNHIIGFEQLLQEELADHEDKELVERLAPYLQSIEKAAKNLLRMVEDVLYIAQAETGEETVTRENIDVDRLLRDLVDAHEDQARQRGTTLRLEADQIGQVTTDPTKLRICLSHLLSNACRFTEKCEVIL